MDATTITRRWYLRCRDCIEPYVVTADASPVQYGGPDILCACGGKMEAMGEVHGNRWTRTEDLTACDDRCTGARGPNCECACKGENHGTGRTVKVVKDSGPMRLSEGSAVSMRRGEEYRTALAAARARILAKYGNVGARKEAGEYVESDAYWGWTHAHRALSDARSLRTHAGRLKALAAVPYTYSNT